MATELQLQEGFRDVIQTVNGFSPETVFIDEDEFLDSTIQAAPFVVIWTSQAARFTPSPKRKDGNITIPVSLIEEYIGWGATYQNIRLNRQAIIGKIFEGVGMSANGLDGVLVESIDVEPFQPILPQGVSDDAARSGQALPVFIEAPMSINVRLF